MATDVVENVVAMDDDDGYERLPIASTSTPGIAQFSAEDFSVTADGVVKALSKAGAIQYIGTPDNIGDNDITWTIEMAGTKDVSDVAAGDIILCLSDDDMNGDLYTVTSVIGTVITTSTIKRGSIRGPEGKQGVAGANAAKIIEMNLVDISSINNELSGVWQFNRKLNFDSVSGEFTEKVSFKDLYNDIQYSSMTIGNPSVGNDFIQYDSTTIYAGSWIDESTVKLHTQIDFGTSQQVSNEFYTFIKNNAVNIDTGTVRYKLLVEFSDGTSIDAGIITINYNVAPLRYDNIYYHNSPNSPTLHTFIVQEQEKFNRKAVIGDIIELYVAWWYNNALQNMYVAVGKVTASDDTFVQIDINNIESITGPQGIPGKDGKDGAGFEVVDILQSASELPDAGTTADNLAYLVGNDADDYDLYVQVGIDTKEWKDVGKVESVAGVAALTYNEIYQWADGEPTVNGTIIQEVAKFNRTAMIGDVCIIVVNAFNAGTRWLTTCHVTNVDSSHVTLNIDGLVNTSGLTGPQGEDALMYSGTVALTAYNDTTFTVQTSAFNRTPVQNEMFFASYYGNDSTGTYVVNRGILIASVTSISGITVTCTIQQRTNWGNANFYCGSATLTGTTGNYSATLPSEGFTFEPYQGQAMSGIIHVATPPNGLPAGYYVASFVFNTKSDRSVVVDINALIPIQAATLVYTGIVSLPAAMPDLNDSIGVNIHNFNRSPVAGESVNCIAQRVTSSQDRSLYLITLKFGNYIEADDIISGQLTSIFKLSDALIDIYDDKLNYVTLNSAPVKGNSISFTYENSGQISDRNLVTVNEIVRIRAVYNTDVEETTYEIVGIVRSVSGYTVNLIIWNIRTLFIKEHIYEHVITVTGPNSIFSCFINLINNSSANISNTQNLKSAIRNIVGNAYITYPATGGYTTSNTTYNIIGVRSGGGANQLQIMYIITGSSGASDTAIAVNTVSDAVKQIC